MSRQAANPAADGNRYYALDLMRFLAAFSVLGFHWNWVTTDEMKRLPLYPEQWFRFGGMLGVIFFFIISGFVILRSAQGATPLGFASSRAIRLYPAFWICCTLTYLLTDPWLYHWRGFLINLTMFPGPLGAILVDEVYWTLVLEAKFYFMIWLLLVARSLRRVELFLWGWLAWSQLPDFMPFREWAMSLPSVREVATLLFDMENGGRDFSTYAPFFVGGCACFLLGDRTSLTRWLLLACAIGAGAFEAAELARRTASLYQFRPVGIVTGLAVSFFLLVLAISLRKLRLPPSRVLLTLGAMSYPLYLLHMYIGVQFLSGLREAMPFELLYFLVLAAILGMSWCVVVFAEVPLQAWLRSRLARWTGAAHAPAARA